MISENSNKRERVISQDNTSHPERVKNLENIMLCERVSEREENQRSRTSQSQ